jgi:hypothetical protein
MKKPQSTGTVWRTTRSLVAGQRHIAWIILSRLQRWLQNHPKLAALCRSLIRVFPPLQRRLSAMAGADVPRAPTWSLDVDPQTLDDWKGSIRQLALTKKDL